MIDRHSYRNEEHSVFVIRSRITRPNICSTMKLEIYFLIFFKILNQVSSAVNSHLATTDSLPCVIDNIEWIQFKHNNRCIQIIDDIGIAACTYTRFHNLYLTLRLLVPKEIHNWDLSQNRGLCEMTNIVATTNVTLVEHLFNGKRKYFLPFAFVYLILNDGLILSNEIKLDTLRNGLNVYRVSNMYNNTFSVVRNILTDEIMNSIDTRRNDLQHLLFNREKRNEYGIVFRVSLFNCPPYVMLEEKRCAKTHEFLRQVEIIHCRSSIPQTFGHRASFPQRPHRTLERSIDDVVTIQLERVD